MFVIKSLEKTLLQYGEEGGVFAVYGVVFYSTSKGIHHRKLRWDYCVGGIFGLCDAVSFYRMLHR